MKFLKPDFYDDFKCIASRCRHSCCVGWEIDIDADTMELYKGLPGEIGNELRCSVAADPEPHFIMTSDGRCPFLCQDGLCRLILTYGDNILCDICAEHPRFYNCTGGREECGLGLCCEEAVRLLYASDAVLEYIMEDDGETDCDTPLEAEIFALRAEIFSALSDRAVPLHERLRKICGICGVDMPELNIGRWAQVYLRLEMLNSAWGEKLRLLEDLGEFSIPNLPRYERLASYLIYRHFISASSVRFAVLSAAMVAALDSVTPPEEHAENLRMYSEEIEYSDENIDKIFAFMDSIC